MVNWMVKATCVNHNSTVSEPKNIVDLKENKVANSTEWGLCSEKVMFGWIFVGLPNWYKHKTKSKAHKRSGFSPSEHLSSKHHRLLLAHSHYFLCMLWQSDTSNRTVVMQVNMTAWPGQIILVPSGWKNNRGGKGSATKRRMHQKILMGRIIHNKTEIRQIFFVSGGINNECAGGEEDVVGRGGGREGSGGSPWGADLRIKRSRGLPSRVR